MMSEAKETRRNAENGLTVFEGQKVIEVDGYLRLGFSMRLPAEMIDASRDDVEIAIMQAVTGGDYDEIEAKGYEVTGP